MTTDILAPAVLEMLTTLPTMINRPAQRTSPTLNILSPNILYYVQWIFLVTMGTRLTYTTLI